MGDCKVGGRGCEVEDRDSRVNELEIIASGVGVHVRRLSSVVTCSWFFGVMRSSSIIDGGLALGIGFWRVGVGD